MSHVNNIVKKPWGYEYLAYENEYVALWSLYISKDQQTSMHCHPNKTTGLMVVEGQAQVSFLNDTFTLNEKHKIMIRKGLFHSTKAVSANGAHVFEIETPVDKHDLVRLNDKYGRTAKPYEGKDKEIPKADDCLWIEDPPAETENKYRIGNKEILVKTTSDSSFIDGLNDDANIVFLRGGLCTDYGIKVAGPGDIVVAKVLKELKKLFQKVEENTVILRLS